MFNCINTEEQCGWIFLLANREAFPRNYVQDLAKLQDLGSLILLVLKVGISIQTREDQTVGRGITVSTSCLPSPRPPSLHHFIHPSLAAVAFILNKGKLLDIFDLLGVFVFINPGCKCEEFKSLLCLPPPAKSLNLLSDTSGGQNKQIGSPASSSSLLHTHTEVPITEHDITGREKVTLTLSRLVTWPQGWKFKSRWWTSWKKPFQDGIFFRLSGTIWCNMILLFIWLLLW